MAGAPTNPLPLAGQLSDRYSEFSKQLLVLFAKCLNLLRQREDQGSKAFRSGQPVRFKDPNWYGAHHTRWLSI